MLPFVGSFAFLGCRRLAIDVICCHSTPAAIGRRWRSNTSPLFCVARQSSFSGLRFHSSRATKPVVSKEEAPNRLMTFQERVAVCPHAVKALWDDYLRYTAIRDAGQTKRNLWNSKIPRRQQIQQQNFVNAVSVVLPFVVLWMPPLIGYVFMFASVVFPRQVLSRHFHNDYEQKHFNYLAHQQRSRFFSSTQQAMMSTHSLLKTFLSQAPAFNVSDEAGPVLENVLELHELLVKSNVYDLDCHPRPYLKQFALAAGVLQTMPISTLSYLIACTPTMLLRRQSSDLAIQVGKDDRALLDEPEPSMTPMELHDACLARGLPVPDGMDDPSTETMRTCLQNHLSMMKQVLPKRLDDEDMGLLALHLTMIRNYYKQQLDGQSAKT